MGKNRMHGPKMQIPRSRLGMTDMRKRPKADSSLGLGMTDMRKRPKADSSRRGGLGMTDIRKRPKADSSLGLGMTDKNRKAPSAEADKALIFLRLRSVRQGGLRQRA
jgi:hypothetical protein